MRAWNTDFRDWLENSAFGGEEGAANNHGTFYDMQLAALAYATGGGTFARRTVLGAESKRIDPQVSARTAASPRSSPAPAAGTTRPSTSSPTPASRPSAGTSA